MNRANRRLLLVGAEGEAAAALRGCFAEFDIVPDLAAALALPADRRPDGVVVDAAVMAPAPLIDQLKAEAGAFAPVVVYAPAELEAEDDRRLRLAVFGGLVRMARSVDQLLDQASLVIHAPMGRLPETVKTTLAQSRHEDAVLTGRTAVVVDDDIRNIFSLASALEEYGVELRYAESGRAGLELLQSLDPVDVLLVDIMMPDMDGYETIREVRSMARFGDLPIIAVTAKAMKGDRQKCIQAGASDYVSKPVDIDHLISVLRVSIQRADAVKLAGDPVVPPIPAAS